MDRPTRFSDAELIAELERLRAEEREQTLRILERINEVNDRKAYLDAGYATLFDFCVVRLRYSEQAAARRINSARAILRFPALKSRLQTGELTLSAVSRLEPHLTTQNVEIVVARARGKAQREINDLAVELAFERRATEAAQLAPEPETTPEPSLFESPPSTEPTTESAAPAAAPARSPTPPRRRDTIRLEAPGLGRISFQADEALRRRFDRMKELLRRACPSGRLEEVLARVADDFLARHDPALKKPAPVRPPRVVETRRIPQWVKDHVWARDGGRCAYAAPDGTRCGGRGGLEYDHVTPWSLGGSSDDPQNIRLLCRAHNLRRTRRTFRAVC